jgi:hypothetical protein
MCAMSHGLAAAGAAFAHAGMRAPASVAGALSVATWGALVTGIIGTIAYRIIPPRLTRIERGGALPEDLAARAATLDERAFSSLTGKSELWKVLYARILRPYARAPFGAIALLTSGRSLHAEERRVRARIDVALAGRKSGRLDGLGDLVRVVVERRAIAAQRVLHGVLRGWLPVHVVLTAIALVLLAFHVAFALAYR